MFGPARTLLMIAACITAPPASFCPRLSLAKGAEAPSNSTFLCCRYSEKINNGVTSLTPSCSSTCSWIIGP
jgi:hypothetical protein